MAISSSTDCDVVVVGGGPVGLLTAFLAAEAGIDVVVLEAQTVLPHDLRATSFHPPTLDLLHSVGLADALISAGVRCPDWQIRRHPSGERAVFDISVIADETGHPFRLQCEQWRLSRLLLDRLAAHGGASVLPGARATAIRQRQDRIGVTALGIDGAPFEVKGRLAVGTDGYQSSVRQWIDAPFLGETFPETTLVVTTRFPFEDHLDGLSMVTSCWTRDSHVAMLRLPDMWRLALYPDERRPLEEQASAEAVESILQDLVPRPDPFEVLRVWPYRVQQRCVPSFRAGNVVLAGDAAHVNSPAGGLGLNTGIHDAFALADALIDIFKRGATMDRLDTYDAQRRPIAEAMLRQAGENRNRMRQTSPERQAALLADLQATARDRDRLRSFVRRASMIEALAAHDPQRLQAARLGR